MKKLLFLVFAGFQLLSANAQGPRNWTSAEMYQALRKLNILGSVLYVAAHPDDENTRLITYFSKDKLYRTGYMSMTRGDGGQNLIGDEQGIELGLIRTQELLAARRIDGGEQFFSRAYDFGFSKNPEETFKKWDKEKILSDVVWVIRKFQPDVIITRFPTTGEGGHGHHTASAILATEAFTAAADPNRFPEQLKYVQTWQVKRILWNSFNFGGVNTTSADQFKIDVGGYNPLLGKSYGEIAAESRSQHKSQGFGATASRGEALEYFKTLDGTVPANDLMDGVDLSWKKVQGGEVVSGMIENLTARFDFLHPEKSVKGLVETYAAIKKLPESVWRNKKLSETRELIEQCSGLFIDAFSPDQFAVQTDSIRINLVVNDRLGVKAAITKIELIGNFDSTVNETLAMNRNFMFSRKVLIGEDRRISQPYWLENKMEEGYYNVTAQTLIGQADILPSYQASLTINIEGEDFRFTKDIKYKFTDPVKGELYQPLTVLPNVLASVEQPVKLSFNTNQFEGTINIINKSKNNELAIDYLTVEDKNAKETYNPGKFSLRGQNANQDVYYKINGSANKEYHFVYNDKHIAGHALPVNYGGDKLTDANFEHRAKDFHQIKYDHIPFITYFSDATVKNVNVDLKVYGKKIGYIIGAGDKVPEGLAQMGYEVTLLTDKELSRNNLQQFDAIITGVRAYNTNEWMNKYYDKLMKYVSDGGNLIVQYNTSSNIGPVRAKIGPYNFNISRTRITDETAPVTFLKPAHPVLNFPNKITQDDFKGWIQERSIYHAAAWDSTKFETVLTMNDPGEKADEGSLIIAKHGKGVFVYTGIVFFRELPAGVPGAYRLLANIIALNRKKAF
jgi:LmbE family N-acetylglucosaminyl deacetylase